MITPPLGDELPDLVGVCVRDLGTALCGKPAVIHIMWTPDGENSAACTEHAAEVRRLHAFVGFHRWDRPCGLYGQSVWLPDEDRCVIPDEDDDPALTVAAVLAVLAAMQEVAR